MVLLQRYQVKIVNMDQPLLVSKSKARELRAGAQETVYLVPELCRMTGLTDRMRENFNLMRALAEHTRVGPNIRMQKLLAFNKRLQSVPEVITNYYCSSMN
jgi:aubergine-like protein